EKTNVMRTIPGLRTKGTNKIRVSHNDTTIATIMPITPPKVVDEEVIFCEISIMSQCRALLTVSSTDIMHLLGKPLSSDLIRRLADHITRFSLADIKAVAESPPVYGEGS
ncbi:MAG: CerR family C-terminal domain-containing protein, partial [Deltaproteobacteria bacterium]|nr:CerR family C-terminal domain-containing protein [Deltaproteobacteria bacterium]